MRNTLHRLRALNRQQTGDTIVEVLICIAVVSTILAGAFVVSNRSSVAVRTSEEHAQALQYLQGQIELLRADAAGKMYATMPAQFCYQADATIVTPYNATTCTPAGSIYVLSIEKVTAPLLGQTTATFKATVTWDSLGGSTQNQEQLFYRTTVAG